MINIQIQGQEVLRQHLNNLVAYLKTPKITLQKAVFESIGDIKKHFASSEGPEGKWQPLKESTIRAKGSSRILWDSGRLINSINIRNTVIKNQSAEIGTNIKYARVHQYGSPKGNIPARTFMYLSTTATDKIEKYFIDDINGALK